MTNLLNQHQDFIDPDHRWSKGEDVLIKRGRWVYFHRYLSTLGEPDQEKPEITEKVAKSLNSEIIYQYAKDLLKGRPWPAAEKQLLKLGSLFYLIQYAENVKHGPWPEAEKVLLKSGKPEYIHQYARDVRHGNRVSRATGSKRQRWPEAEKAIIESKSSEWIYRYAVDCKARGEGWPEAEETLVMNDRYLETGGVCAAYIQLFPSRKQEIIRLMKKHGLIKPEEDSDEN